jgi:Ca-activated chloride channel homolog
MFTHPQGFWLLLLLVPVGFFAWRRFAPGRRDLLALAGVWRQERMRNAHLVKWFFGTLSVVVCVVAATIALSGISWGRYAVGTTFTGTDVCLLIDVSRSMLAQDVFPSRLERTASVIGRIIAASPGTRFSVVVFKGTAVEIVPPTDDTESISEVVGALDPAMLTSGGTNIATGIRAAVDSFPAQDGAKKLVLMFSDGGSLTGDAAVAARDASGKGVVIDAIPVGTAAGGPIPLPNGSYVLDASGARVTVKLDSDVLAQISQATGGEVVSISDPLLPEKVANQIAATGDHARAGEFRVETKDQFRVFLIVALVSLAAGIFVRSIRWRDMI